MFIQSRHKDYPAHIETSAAELEPNSSLAMMARMVGERKQVLDVGCAGGYFARVLGRQQCDVVGIDANPSAIEAARAYCTMAILADLDVCPLRSVVDDRKFDVVVFGDVLEHLANPARVLEEARGVLREGGFVVASIPNVAHGAVRLALLSGNFDYQEFGILDDSHKRFFTFKTIDELFLDAGYRIEAVERTHVGIFEGSDLIPAVERAAFDDGVVADIENDPDATTLQFILRAAPLSDESRHRVIAKRFLTANTELFNTRARLEAQTNEIEGLRASLAERDELLAATRGHLENAEIEMRRAQADYRRVAEQAGAAGALQERVEHLNERSARLEEQLAQTHRLEVEYTRAQEQLKTADLHVQSLRESYERRIETEREAFMQEAALEHERQLGVLEQSERLLNELRAEMAESEARFTDTLIKLDQAHEALAASRSELRQTSDRLEEMETKLDEQMRTAAASKEELTAALTSARSEIDDLSAKLLAHVEAAAAAARARSEEIAACIERIQSGRIWRFKRFLRRVFKRG